MYGEIINGYPVLGAEGSLSNFPNAFILPDNEWVNKSELEYSRLISLVDPSAFVSRTAIIGRGCVVYPNCFVGLNTQIGDHVLCLSGSIINHDSWIDENVIIASAVSLAGGVHVESGAYLGQGCSCKGGVRIGKNSIIGMGSIVLKDVPPNSVMIGNPARKLRDNQVGDLAP